MFMLFWQGVEEHEFLDVALQRLIICAVMGLFLLAIHLFEFMTDKTIDDLLGDLFDWLLDKYYEIYDWLIDKYYEIVYFFKK